MTREQFIQKYYPGIVAISKDTNVFPTVMLAQAIIESSGKVNGVYLPGESLLSKNANNYFGIKASSSWKGATITLKTGEYLNGQYITVSGVFRKYDNPIESFKDYIQFLKDNPRYTAAGVFTATTPGEQAERLQKAGYATDPNYSNLIKGVINSITKYLPNISTTVAFSGTALILIVGIYLFLNR
jgi:flagellum-specific peptidoglycan hydrolase FlgJ